MSAILQQNLSQAENAQRIVVVGSGPVGVRFAQDLLRHQPDATITVLGNEPYRPYNRVQLSSFLAGEISRDQLDIDLSGTSTARIQFAHAVINKVDRANRVVIDEQGQAYPYDVLVLATGARAYLPHIEGRNLSGVFCFRSVKDAEHLYARIHRSRHIVIVGGGLLGCEAAKSLTKYHTQVTLIQQADRLMNRQLDRNAAEFLKDKLESFGIHVVVNDGVRKVLGDSRVSGVETRTGQKISCDTVLFCAGISPNMELARNAGLKVATGIVVSDQMQTSDTDIYAVGECCEHRGQTYGLVNPGFEQAAVAASHINGDYPEYKGSLSVSRLKVVGEQICSMGEVEDLQPLMRQKVLSYQDKKQPIYRKLVLHKSKIVGALAVGEWPEMNRVQEAFVSARKLSWWQIFLFRRYGRLWFTQEEADVHAWPENTVICQCNALNRGQLSQAISAGCTHLEMLQQKTKAGTVCGSCKPLLQQLCQGGEAKPQKEIAWLPILVMSLMAALVATLIAYLPAVTVADSVQTQSWFEKIWNDDFYKQVTGFSLLGLTLIGLLMSLRKRLKTERFGAFAYWRLLHIALGVACSFVLIFHTGLHLGKNLNQFLIIDFLSVLGLGASAGAVVAFSHKFSPAKALKLRQFWAWAHIVFTWPLPALLLTHIMTVYYF